MPRFGNYSFKSSKVNCRYEKIIPHRQSHAALALRRGRRLHCPADVKIKTKSTSGGQASEQVTYIKGKRQRAENNEASVTITQCDLRRTLQLGVPTKTYVATPFEQKTDVATPAAKGTTTEANAIRRGGVVTSAFTSTDTGERKKMFGYTARRIKTSIATESSPDACQVTRSKMETDGWYIDAQFALDCENVAAATYAQATQAAASVLAAASAK